MRALGVVIDPELDEPITDLGFVHTVDVMPDGDVEVHLRLPTSFCAPNFAYLMASDAKDVLAGLDWTRTVTVELDDHHDSDIINRGLAADAGYRGTFAHEAETDLDELRVTFQRKAHTAAMERCLTALLRADPARPVTELGTVTIADLPGNATTESLLRRRVSIGLSTTPVDLVMVDHQGNGYTPESVPLMLRRARSTRISIDGNAHFCRGLLRTRYTDGGSETVREPSAFIPLSALTH
ncbi:iron-sulfur cluster assembly protein [Mycolicibacterium komossense]|uniref:Iron-sulfur cluster assembly protein n=1 Tax=Mycolicibacterium komossense TaxID=1779 RepID=A0ABT3C9V5_9MYCO|nr:iron-sulfur cluster assembly protein [Mycolicibacterium komossense]MCV7226232.1 iron-sulfur cluster assembly protein [Mycolicibacterium komossense]